MEYVLNILLNKRKTHVLMQLKDRTQFAGKYNFPGGKVQPNEPKKAAAFRELQEETGVTKEQTPDFQWLGTLTLPFDCTVEDPNHDATLHFYGGTVDQNLPEQQPNETEQLMWFNISDIPTMRKKNQLAGNGEIDYFLNFALNRL